MCGIGGFIINDINFLKTNIQKIIRTAIHQENRGTDAAGIYIIDKDLLDKEPIPMRYFLSDRILSNKIELEDFQGLLFHTRAATKGDPEINENNHPFAEKDIVLAHNGMITSDETIRKKYNLPDKPETDTYTLVALIQKLIDEGIAVAEAIKKALETIDEETHISYAVWIYDRNENALYLARNTNPIEYIYKEGEYFIFASELSDIYKEAKDLPAYELYRLDIDKIKLEKVCDIEHFYYYGGYYYYNWKRDRFVEDKKYNYYFFGEDGDYCYSCENIDVKVTEFIYDYLKYKYYEPDTIETEITNKYVRVDLYYLTFTPSVNVIVNLPVIKKFLKKYRIVRFKENLKITLFLKKKIIDAINKSY